MRGRAATVAARAVAALVVAVCICVATYRFVRGE